MTITIEQVKELRDETGVSVMQCKKALEESDGDMEKARIILSKKRGEAVSKKAGRQLGSGVVGSYIHSNYLIGAMVVLSCETDFVAKNEDFKKLAYEIAMHIAASDPDFKNWEEIEQAELQKTREVFKAEAKDKPKDIQEKVIKGKVEAYFADRILLEQTFIKDPDMKIKDLIEAAVHKFGERIEISQFVRFSV